MLKKSLLKIYTDECSSIGFENLKKNSEKQKNHLLKDLCTQFQKHTEKENLTRLQKKKISYINDAKILYWK